MIDFSGLRLSRKPNQYLMAPPGLCPNAIAHRESPVFEMPAGDLMMRFMAVASAAPDVSLSERDNERRQVELVQHSALFRFPDDISAAFLALEDGGSTLAVYSRSRYGYSDFGVNRRRVEDWTWRLGAAK
ncbi:MAG: DUF1499 domain-containing protein [Minwuiales bacterium]|nr:DUF1499 domain-containing protein [Minwuiales bacterium]